MNIDCSFPRIVAERRVDRGALVGGVDRADVDGDGVGREADGTPAPQQQEQEQEEKAIAAAAPRARVYDLASSMIQITLGRSSPLSTSATVATSDSTSSTETSNVLGLNGERSIPAG